MNSFLPEPFDERTYRLALGIEPVDAERGMRLASSLRAELEGLRGFEPVQRHPSCVHVLLERAGLTGPIPVRFGDASRRYVPRRFNVGFTSGTPTLLRPRFYPGAAYDVSARCTALRGRVLRGTPPRPLRWARIEARLPASTPRSGRIVGSAHGDDRGEFLLLIHVDAATVGPIVDPLPIEVTAFGPLPTPPVPSTLDLPALDPLWDVPLEPVPQPPPDQISAGTALPAGYGATSSSTVVVNARLSEQVSLPDVIFD